MTRAESIRRGVWFNPTPTQRAELALRRYQSAMHYAALRAQRAIDNARKQA